MKTLLDMRTKAPLLPNFDSFGLQFYDEYGVRNMACGTRGRADVLIDGKQMYVCFEVPKKVSKEEFLQLPQYHKAIKDLGII